MTIIIVVAIIIWLPLSIVFELTNNYRYKKQNKAPIIGAFILLLYQAFRGINPPFLFGCLSIKRHPIPPLQGGFLCPKIHKAILRPFPCPYSDAGAFIGKHPGNAGNTRHAPNYGHVSPGKKEPEKFDISQYFTGKYCIFAVLDGIFLEIFEI